MKPQRIQLSRRKGWKMPPNTVKVDRATAFGNPFIAEECRNAGYVGTDNAVAERCVKVEVKEIK